MHGIKQKAKGEQFPPLKPHDLASIISCPTITYLGSPENWKRLGKGNSESFDPGLSLKL